MREIRRTVGVFRRFRLVIVGSGLLVALLALGFTYPMLAYRVTSRVLIRPVGEAVPTLPAVGLVPRRTGLDVLDLAGQTYVQLLQSRPVAERIVELLSKDGEPGGARSTPGWREASRKMVTRVFQGIGVVLHLRRPAGEMTPEEEKVLAAQEAISGNLLRRSSVFEITAEHRDPHEARKLARATAEAFVEFAREFNAAEAVLTRTFLEEQVRQTRHELEETQARLDQFRREHGVLLSLEDEGKQRVTEFLTLEAQSRKLETDLRHSRERLRRLRQELDRYPGAVQASQTTDVNPTFVDLRRRLIDLESQLPRLLIDFRPSHPQVVALREEIAEIKTRLSSEAQRLVTSEVTELNPVHQQLLSSLVSQQVELEGLAAQKAAVDALVARFKGELGALSRNMNAVDLLVAETKFEARRLDQLMEDLAAAKLTEAKKLEEVRLLEVGAMPRFPTWKGLPLGLFLLVGLGIGLFGGSGLALALDALDRRVRDPEVAQERLALPLYGVVASAGIRETMGTLEPTSEPSWKSYRDLRRKLLAASANGRPVRFIVLTCADAGEDPTPVGVRLAAVCAEGGVRALLADCREGPSKLHQLTRAVGRLANLEVFTDGSGQLPAATDPLRIEKLLSLMESWRSSYDVVLLLGPSLGEDGEVAALAARADLLLVVMRHGKTDLDACQAATNRLSKAGIRKMGLVYIT